ncbi:holo-ACP synthase [Atopobium fossor]|uniref:holo-ACP synthase n=1 Tax=Atopobium fossor TaxID=39487 RepID=UPI000408F3E1|nr:holo-ACP synthase [Atopobium fossor]
MALAGVGVDIFEIARMERALERRPYLAKRMFTVQEQQYCNSKARPAQHYACRFAAREAVLKALGTGFSQGIGLSDVSVSHDAHGKPVAVLCNKALEIAQQNGVLEVALSLSFTHELAVANAVAVTDQVRPKKDEKPDSKAQLAASFKEARSVIDELERVQITTNSLIKE